MPQTKSSPNPKPRKAPFRWDLDGIPAHFCWNKLKSLRENSGLSQAELAVCAGLSLSIVYQLEAGHDARTTADTKRKLADFFDCKVDDIFPVAMIGAISEKEYLLKKLAEDASENAQGE